MGSNMLPYRYGLLKPQQTLGAKEHNTAWLGSNTLGIEMTEPELAASCGLGNIEPQHLGGDQYTAVIEAVLSWPLPTHLRAKE
jgi:hypothetical protein